MSLEQKEADDDRSGESQGDGMVVQCRWVQVIFEVLALFQGFILVIYFKN